MLLRLCSQHYFILVMNPVTFIIIINSNNNNNKGNEIMSIDDYDIFACY